MRCTLREAQAKLAAHAMTLRKLDGEYRVNFRSGHESTAYYTDDLADAVRTAIVMRARNSFTIGV